MSKYAFGKTVNMSYDQAIAAVTQALAKEGFGVLTEIDVQATLKKKLNLDRPPYKILGACNPTFASRAIAAELGISEQTVRVQLSRAMRKCARQLRERGVAGEEPR